MMNTPEKKLDGLPHGIKELVAYDHVWMGWTYLLWILATLSVLVILYLLWRFLKNRKQKIKNVELTPLEKLMQIKALFQKENYRGAQAQRDFYESVVAELRKHLVLFKQVDISTKTISEIDFKAFSKQLEASEVEIQRLHDLFARADRVKFAGDLVEGDQLEQDLEQILLFAQQVKTQAERVVPSSAGSSTKKAHPFETASPK